jgi:hypothetical protein
LVERDDLVLLVAMCLSGLAHFVIHIARHITCCHSAQEREFKVFWMTWRAACGRPWVWETLDYAGARAAAENITRLVGPGRCCSPRHRMRFNRPVSVYRLSEMPIQSCGQSVSAPRGKAAARLNAHTELRAKRQRSAREAIYRNRPNVEARFRNAWG